jgi:hypothetical protein
MRQDMTVITPEIGNVLWYRLEPEDIQPFTAAICYVWGDGMVNVAGFDHAGKPYAAYVKLRQEGDPQPPFPYAEWMPHQIAQAQKREKDAAWEREMEEKDAAWKREAEALGLVVHHDEPQQQYQDPSHTLSRQGFA